MNVTVCPVFNVDHFLNVIDEQPLISAVKLSEFADSIGLGAVRIAAIEESSDRGQLKLTSDVLEFQGVANCVIEALMRQGDAVWGDQHNSLRLRPGQFVVPKLANPDASCPTLHKVSH